ncbi:MAG: SpoIIE family protein phosphatase [Bacteroidales bacterium]|jgi:serine phosphatase RsbU (regulator of sigma subunit)|nr:SpoIIE family protein phosphatase [Bacteroidales bacterium]
MFIGFGFLKLNISAAGSSIVYALDLSRHTIFVYLSAAILFIVLVWALVKKYNTVCRLLKEKNHVIDMVRRQNVILKQREKDLTDSLVYAQRIQEARLPSEEYFRNYFPSSFVFFKPQSIVSGDFYWIGEREQWIFVVAADCTGHGVSGALMSMIGIEIIEKAITEYRITTPSKILAYLNETVEKTFSRTKNTGSVIMDGMDIGLCAINKTDRRVVYSGAFFPLYIISDNSLTQIKSDKIMIGMNPDRIPYTDHEISIKDNDILYMFSDGYADQFGGKDNKKFMYRRFRYLLLNIHTFDNNDQKAVLDENLTNWMGNNNQQVDDIMVIGFRPF